VACTFAYYYAKAHRLFCNTGTIGESNKNTITSHGKLIPLKHAYKQKHSAIDCAYVQNNTKISFLSEEE